MRSFDVQPALRAILGMLLGISTSGFAQAPTPPPGTAPVPPAAGSVDELRAGFLKGVLTDSQLLTEQYERALARLEAEIVATGDYEEARLIQQRRDELKALYPTNGSQTAQSQGIPLLPAQARLGGTAEARGDTLTGWRTTGSSAEWSGLRLNPGSYFLEVEANLVEIPQPPGSLAPTRARPQDRAEFEFYEVSLLANAAETRRVFEITTNADDTTFTPVRVGPLTFTRSPVTLRLTSSAGYPGNMVRLRNPRLVPAVTEVIPTAPAAPVVATTLDDIRKSYQDALATVQKPVTAAYLARLRALSQSKPELKDEVEAEYNRAARLASVGREGALERLRTVAGQGAAGYEDLDGARFVEDPANEGDQFVVEHQGNRFPVKLLWVQCAPVKADSTRLKAVTSHFEIGEGEALDLGRTAREFTQGYLEGKALRLLLRPGQEKDGSRAALVFLPEVGLFQSVLVEQGLAMVKINNSNARRGGLESAFLSTLQEREQSAKKRDNGAWALSPPNKKK